MWSAHQAVYGRYGRKWPLLSALLFYISYFNKYFSQQRDSLGEEGFSYNLLTFSPSSFNTFSLLHHSIFLVQYSKFSLSLAYQHFNMLTFQLPSSFPSSSLCGLSLSPSSFNIPCSSFCGSNESPGVPLSKLTKLKKGRPLVEYLSFLNFFPRPPKL
jgi:hypothetical protein